MKLSLTKIAHLILIVFKISPALFLLNIFFYVTSAIIPLLNLLILKEIVNIVVEIIQGNEGIVKGLIMLTIQALISIVSWLLDSLHTLVLMRLKQKSTFHFQLSIIDKVNKIPLIFYDDFNSYNLIERSSAAEEHGLEIINSNLEIVKNLITLIGFLLLLLQLHWILPLTLILLMIPPLWVNIKIGQNRYRQVHELTALKRRTDYLLNILKGKEAAKELRMSSHGNYIVNMWKKKTLFINNEQFELEKKAVKSNFIVFSVKDISSILFIGGLLHIATNGSLSVGDYFVYSQGITFSLSLVGEISSKIAAIYESSSFMNDYFDFIKLPEENTNNNKFTRMPPIINQISINNISFTYPNSEIKVLKNISFKINKGDKIAIVGNNGSGKSTLINCIIGLYKPTYGNIKYNGISISDLNNQQLRQKISTLFQDFVRYQLTIKENICLSDIKAIKDSTRLKNVSIKSDISLLIQSLKYGYETELGTAYSGGQELSGGQWQKIGLARALFKDSEIMILDEPTAALDPIAETEIFNSFLRAAKDKTTIFITHRLGICKSVDRIIVLDKGVLVEEGSHEDLLKANGKYAKMFKAQSDWYTPMD